MALALQPYWQYAGDRPPPPIAPERLADPLAQLPPRVELSSDEQAWLATEYPPGVSFNWFKVAAHSRAWTKRGPSPKQHAERRRRFAELKQQAEAMGFRLPAEFVALMESDEYVSRLRFGSHRVDLPEFIERCPLDEGRVMFLFLSESQGCNYTHLLLAPDGSHCVTRSGHDYGMHPNPPNAQSTPEERKIYLWADNFAECLCRLSDKIRADEVAGARTYLEMGDKARADGLPTSARECYLIALSYAPDSAEIRERIAGLG